MRENFSRNFIIFLALFLASCSSKDNQETKIRIVDLQGKSRPVITRMPELNAQALVAQSRVFEEKKLDYPNPQAQQNNLQSQQDLAQATFPPLAPTAPAGVNPRDVQFAESTNSLPTNNPAAVEVMKAKEKVVQYDLAKEYEDEKPRQALKEETSIEKKPSTNSAKKGKFIIVKNSESQRGIFVQAGSFGNAGNAKIALEEMEKFHKGSVVKVDGEKPIYRVLLGPFKTKAKAKMMVTKIKNSGHDAIIVRNR